MKSESEPSLELQLRLQVSARGAAGPSALGCNCNRERTQLLRDRGARPQTVAATQPLAKAWQQVLVAQAAGELAGLSSHRQPETVPDTLSLPSHAASDAIMCFVV